MIIDNDNHSKYDIMTIVTRNAIYEIHYRTGGKDDET